MSKALRASDAVAAAAVAKLRKPSMSAWAIDQVAAQDADIVAELLAAGADARDAQQALGQGDGSGEHLRQTVARLRETVEAAARSAESMLAAAGHASSEETARRIRDTLRAAATGSADLRVAMWRGTLDGNLPPAGFGGDGDDADPPALARVLAPLRQGPPPAGRARLHVLPQPTTKRAPDREGERLEEAARKAQTTATAKRGHADRLAEAARLADDEAIAAEQAAQAAEDALASDRDAT